MGSGGWVDAHLHGVRKVTLVEGGIGEKGVKNNFLFTSLHFHLIKGKIKVYKPGRKVGEEEESSLVLIHVLCPASKLSKEL